MKLLPSVFLILIILFSSILSWHNMIYKADTLAAFYNDELPNVQSSTSFFANGVYRNDKYGLVYSSGIAVTWPSAVGWYLGHNMLASRLGCAFFSWIFSLLLIFWFFRLNGYARAESITAAVIFWGFTITTPFALPYWFGFMYNLGELNTILLIGFGVFLFGKRPLLSSFIFGVAFWHGKFVYFPLILTMLAGCIFTQGLTARKTVIMAARCAGIFLLPLFIWLGWLLLKLGVPGLKEWLSDELGWFSYTGTKHTPLASLHISWDALKERLTSSKFEWVGYALGTKLKNLLFSFGAILLTLGSLIAAKKKIIKITGREAWLSIMAAVSIGIYCVFYFLINPFMWQRYFLPAIYTGFFLFIFFGVKWMKNISLNLRPVFYAAALILLIAQTAGSIKHPFLERQTSYARLCTDLHSVKYDKDIYK